MTTDGFTPYVNAVEDAFGGNIDYGQLIKLFQGEVEPGRERYIWTIDELIGAA